MRTGHGTEGSRHYDWAMLEVTSDDAPGHHHGKRDAGRSALLVRLHRYTGTCSFYRCWTPGSVPLTRALECLRRCHTVITTNYSCRN